MDNATELIWPTFDDFWDAYDKKVGKPNAIKQWKKLKQKDKELVMMHVPVYVKSREKQYRKDPERYLKHRTFEDEIIINDDPKTTTSDARKSEFLRSVAEKYKQQ